MKNMIYGALADTHLTSETSIPRQIKRKAFEIRDRLLFEFNSTSLLDYRNHDKWYSTNKGDIAIAEAISSLMTSLNPEVEFSYKNWGELPKHENIKSEKCNLIVAGGGYFFVKTDGRLPPRLKDDLDFFKSNGISPILFGVGLNIPGRDNLDCQPLKITLSDESIIREILGCSKLISVRDLATKDFLQAYTEKHISLIGDPAIYLGQLSKTNNPISQKTVTSAPVIGINFPFHGPSSNRIFKSNIDKYLQLLNSLKSKTGCRYKYFIHYDAEYIIPKLLRSRHLDIETIQGTPSQLINEYNKVDLHIGGMLHSCIMAHSVGTPCISLAYDIKHLGFFELMGTQENHFSAINFEPDSVVERSLILLAAQDQVRQHIYKQVDFYHSKIIEFGKLCLHTF